MLNDLKKCIFAKTTKIRKPDAASNFKHLSLKFDKFSELPKFLN